LKRLNSEFKKTAESYKVEMKDDDISEWKVYLSVTNYGDLVIHISFPKNYPYSPPRVVIPKIYHPNIYKTGNLCMSILHEGNREVGDAEDMDEKWSPAIWMESLLASLVWVLESPNLDSPANVDAKKLYTSNIGEYWKKNQNLAKSRENEKIRIEQDLAFALASEQDQKLEELRSRKLVAKKRGLDALVEPDQDGGKEVISIRFRTKESVLMRRFSRKSRFGEMKIYLESKGFRPETYRLLTSFPQKDLTETDESATLESLRFSHQETLIVETGGDEKSSIDYSFIMSAPGRLLKVGQYR